MFNELYPSYPEPYIVTIDGIPIKDQWKYIPLKKLYSCTRAELETLVALFLLDEKHKRAYIDSLPADLVSLMKMLLRENAISMMSVRVFAPSIVSVLEYRWGYYYNIRLTAHNVWFDYEYTGKYIEEDNASRVIQEEFISYIRLFRKYFETILREGEEITPIYVESINDEYIVLDAEIKAASSFPIIKGHLKQGVLKRTDLKATAASSKKIFDNVTVEEIFPDYTEMKLKYNLGQLYLPLLDLELWHGKKDSVEYHDIVRNICQSLTKFYSDTLISAMLPYLKGMVGKALNGRCNTRAVRVLKDALIRAEGEWLMIEEFCRKSIDDDNSIVTLSFLREANVHCDINGEKVIISNYRRIMNRGFVQSLCAVLYGLGALTVAFDGKKDTKTDSNPLDRMVAVKLNNLGKYAFNMLEEYTAPDLQQVKCFSLEPDRLVIRSVVEGNPYESLLYDTAVSIGGGRFKMDAESFLKHCKDKSDVESKTKFFQDFICKDLPDNWKAFFDNIAKRCQPFQKEPSDYIVYKVSPDDRELINVLSTDSILKSIVVKAEGFRIMVRKKDKETLVSRLKTFGFLV
ncbi:MAG: hypothetical protein MJZ16_04345 [Bacteroidales bacterium]|nr:hypothetical protein [Bacteroidales bacterium]